MPTACLLSPPEVQKILKIKKTKFFALLYRKKDPIPHFKIGGSLRFSLDKLNWWIEKQER